MLVEPVETPAGPSTLPDSPPPSYPEAMDTPPLDYTAHARAEAGGRSSAVLGGYDVQLETRWSPEQPRELPGPADLLVGALAACILKGVERSRAMMPFDYRTVSVEVTGRRQDAPPRFTSFHYVIRLDTDEPPRRVEILHRNLKQFGTIYNTLAASCEIEGELVVVSSG